MTDDVMAQAHLDRHPTGGRRGRGLPRRRPRRRSPRARAASRSCTRSVTRERRARCCDRPTPRAPAGSCSPRPRSTSTTPRPCVRRRGRIFHLPIVRGVATLEAIEPSAARGFRVLAMAAEGADDLYRTDLSGPGGLRVRQRGARAARRGRRGRRRVGPRPAGRPGGIAEPRRRGDRVPVRVGPTPAAARARRSRRSSRRPPTTSARRSRR